jgi:hypothetical protein
LQCDQKNAAVSERWHFCLFHLKKSHSAGIKMNDDESLNTLLIQSMAGKSRQSVINNGRAIGLQPLQPSQVLP